MSTVLVKDYEATLASAAAEVIIEEARRRQYRRWCWWAMAGIGIALTIGMALIFSGGGASTSSSARGASTAGAGVIAVNSATVEGRFQGVGVLPVPLSGNIRLVAEYGGKVYSTQATNGRWRIKVPAGAYAIMGRSEKVNGGRLVHAHARQCPCRSPRRACSSATRQPFRVITPSPRSGPLCPWSLILMAHCPTDGGPRSGPAAPGCAWVRMSPYHRDEGNRAARTRSAK